MSRLGKKGALNPPSANAWFRPVEAHPGAGSPGGIRGNTYETDAYALLRGPKSRNPGGRQFRTFGVNEAVQVVVMHTLGVRRAEYRIVSPGGV